MSQMRKLGLRYAFLLHRWLGITLGLMMGLWCLSGMVMLWKTWPAPEAERVGLTHEILTFRNPPVIPRLEDRYRSLRLTMAGGIPVLEAQALSGASRHYDLRNGRPLTLSPFALRADAERYAALSGTPGAAHFEGLRRNDQWILNTKDHVQGFYRYAIDGSARRLLYLSPDNGDVVQDTTGRTRFWSWLGPIPHWLYPSLLKRHQRLWANVLIVLSCLGVILTALGLWIGVRRVHTGHRVSPYRGLHLWHHLCGLVFGGMLLSWITTGLLTMNPAGLLARQPTPGWVDRFEGSIDMAELRTAIAALIAHPERHFRDVVLTGQGGSPALSVMTETGASTRLSLSLEDATPSVIALKERTLTSGLDARVDQITQDDSYYFSTRHRLRHFPAYRVIGPDGTRLYLDSRTGNTVLVAESNAKATRWVIYGPHDLDFFAWLRRPFARLSLITPLLVGVSSLSLLGVAIGLTRLRHRARRGRAQRKSRNAPQDRTSSSR